MELVISSLVGALFGLLVGIIFEESLYRTKKRFLKWVHTISYRPRSHIHHPETFSLGKLKTSWLTIDGDGDLTYTPETIKCVVDGTPWPLPPDIKEIRDSIENREIEKKNQGLNYQWNGPLYALDRYVVSRTVPNEDMEITLVFRPTDYYTFQATVMSLDDNLVQPPATLTLRQKYLQGRDLAQPIPFLANGFGIVLVILTKDRKLIFARRHQNTGMRPGEFDVSVVEGTHPVLDRLTTQRGPDIYRTVIRGALEELGIELIQSDITFLGFGVDVEYYQWALLGVACIEQTVEQALELRRRGISGKWENETFEVVDSDPIRVFNYVRNRKIWSAALVAVYWALVHEYGRRRVDIAVKQVFG